MKTTINCDTTITIGGARDMPLELRMDIGTIGDGDKQFELSIGNSGIQINRTDKADPRYALVPLDSLMNEALNALIAASLNITTEESDNG